MHGLAFRICHLKKPMTLNSLRIDFTDHIMHGISGLLDSAKLCF